jgi:Type IV secretion-system coupling protein DNA-binding domain
MNNIILGTDYLTGAPFSVDTKRHINVEGGSGVGKSTLLQNLFVEHIRQGHGGIFIDPHGDTADQITRLIPKSRMRDFIWIDPDATFVPPFNPLHFRSDEELELGKESLFTTFKSLAGTAWGDESARVIINAIDAVCEYFTNPTPIHVFRFMADDTFRDKVLGDSKNPLLKMFQEQYDEKLRDSEQMTKFSPPINKVSKLLRPAILSIIGQTKSLNFLDVMNKRRIVVCRFSKGRLGEEIAQILGSLVVSMISIAALKREKQKKRPPFLMVVDETHNFTHGGRFNTLLAEGRKFGIALVSGTQGMYQLPFARDLLANCPTQIVFNSSGEDAELMAKNWGQESAINQIIGLPRYRFMARTFENDIPKVRTVLADPAVQPRGDEANPTKLIKQSLMRWGTKKKEVEQKIYKFLAS